MTNFVFISPEFPKTYFNFCDRLKKNGITVLGISSTPYENLSSELKSCLTEYYKVSDMNNYDEFKGFRNFRKPLFFAIISKFSCRYDRRNRPRIRARVRCR